MAEARARIRGYASDEEMGEWEEVEEEVEEVIEELIEIDE